MGSVRAATACAATLLPPASLLLRLSSFLEHIAEVLKMFPQEVFQQRSRPASGVCSRVGRNRGADRGSPCAADHGGQRAPRAHAALCVEQMGGGYPGRYAACATGARAASHSGADCVCATASDHGGRRGSCACHTTGAQILAVSVPRSWRAVCSSGHRSACKIVLGNFCSCASAPHQGENRGLCTCFTTGARAESRDVQWESVHCEGASSSR